MKKQLLSAFFVAGLATSALAQSFTVSGPRTIYELPANKAGKGRAAYTFFNLTTGKEVAQADSNTTNWDIAFSGMNVKLNGGASGGSTVSGQILDATSFNSQLEAPVDNYKSDAISNVIQGNGGIWSYDGNGAKGTHSVTPNPSRLVAIKLADGRYVKLEVLNYYKGLPSNIPIDINNASPANYFDPKQNGVSLSKFVSFRYQIAPAGTTDWSQLVTKVVGLKSGAAEGASPGAPATYQLFDLASADTIGITSNTTTTTARWAFGFSTTTILTNGGVSGPGKDSAQVVATAFNSLTTAPTSDYAVDKTAPKAIVSGSNNGWYNYDFNFGTMSGSHAITAIQGRTIAFHDSLGRYAKIAIENYYQGAPAVACGNSQYYTFSYYYNPYGGNETSLAGRDGKALDVTTTLAYPALPTFSVSSTANINAIAAGTTTDDFTVTTNTGDWVASSDNNWISVANTGANTFKVTVAENTGASRNGEVVVTYCNGAGSLPASIKVNQAASTVTSVEDVLLGKGLSVYPNPSAAAELKVTGAETVEVAISDLQGSVVFSGTVAGGDFVNASLKSGVYVVKLVSATQNTTQKLIIQ